ncbi:MAG: enoyl-CoA hydratase/isomerase family protein, partial [Proteobacteria bacterium]|nr:enoyl-CoA hydratase/isomerase family protein [Pseudomonadota bacterium]
MDTNYLLTSVDERVGIVTINRPKALNALNLDLLRELQIVFTRMEENSDVDVVILTGAGSKAFVAGADIKEMSSMNSKQAFDLSRLGVKIIETVDRMSKPVIAAVNGFALGGGLEVALACDFIYASENAKFGFPEVTLGVIPGLGGTKNLSKVVGGPVAKEMIFSGKIIDV